VQRRALGALFAALAAALIAVAVGTLVGAGGNGVRFLVAVASLALAAWLGSMALSALRR
jgi:hypothetical protein